MSQRGQTPLTHASNKPWTIDIDTTIKISDNLFVYLKGTISVECDGDVDWNWDSWSWDVGIKPFSVTADMATVEFDGDYTIEKEWELGHVSVEIITGLLQFDATPGFFIRGDAEVSANFAMKATGGCNLTLTLSPTLAGIMPTDISCDWIGDAPEVEFENVTIKGEIYTGLAWGPGLSFLEGAAKLRLAYRGGIVGNGKVQICPWDDSNRYRWHACEDLHCVQGDVHPRLGPLSVDLLIGSTVKHLYNSDEKDFDPILTYYHSWTFEDGSIKAYCPHYGYRVNVNVTDTEGNQLKDATVSYPLADADKNRFGPWANDVKMDSVAGRWLVYVPRSSPSSVIGGDGNKVTLTAKMKDPLDPFSYLQGTADITEKGMSSLDTPPDPPDAAITIDARIISIRFRDPASGVTNLPAPVRFHPSKSKGAHLPDTIPLKSGNRFTGWNTKPDGSGKRYGPGAYVETKKDLDLYAQFTIISDDYIVIYNANGGISAPEHQFGKIGQPITLSKESAVGGEGMVFLGWSLVPSPEGGELDYKPGDTFFCPPGKTYVVLYAVWTYDPIHVIRIHYDVNGGSIESPIPDRLVRRGSSFQITEDMPEKIGADFLGWSPDKEAEEAIYFPGRSYHFFQDITLYAIWRPISPLDPVTVTFDLNGAPAQPVPEPLTVTPARWITLPDFRPVWNQFHYFEGWSTDPKAVEPEYYPNRPAVFRENTTLYAVWTPFYTITFDLNGGTLNGKGENITQIVRRGSSITLLRAPVRDGYTFLYWRGSRYNPGDRYRVMSDHTFTAEWAKIPPKTGDSSSPLFWIVLMLSGVAGLAAVKKR